jgi:RNA polymerase sigma-70 factor (ECF subfamily)
VADDPNPDPELLKKLERAMLKLPRPTREIFLAHRLDDMSYQEIADRTGLSVREVERHMARAICAIDRSLNGPPVRWWERWFGL